MGQFHALTPALNLFPLLLIWLLILLKYQNWQKFFICYSSLIHILSNKYEKSPYFYGGINILLSIISSSAISSSAISMITTPGLPQYGALVVVGLIAFLSLKEILSASEKWNRSLNSSFNLVILPLMLCFAGIVFFKISEIILP